ncbi:hypothetical protein EJ06DRAFT_386851 [Trichodelitschia bisporula]|uniref:Uncharacterized protein n=1 Tax=Trichodelitschia bisporula TaxID=703511 RepID=A0A6G1HZS4_9PEZI|nr:hypothetical protein EJ06DRAFT_386851 [Trichodelitschia bisporula]
MDQTCALSRDDRAVEDRSICITAHAAARLIRWHCTVLTEPLDVEFVFERRTTGAARPNSGTSCCLLNGAAVNVNLESLTLKHARFAQENWNCQRSRACRPTTPAKGIEGKEQYVVHGLGHHPAASSSGIYVGTLHTVESVRPLGNRRSRIQIQTTTGLWLTGGWRCKIRPARESTVPGWSHSSSGPWAKATSLETTLLSRWYDQFWAVLLNQESTPS